MPILARVRLLHEPRPLREPRRFLTAVYVTALFDLAMLDERPEPELFDLCEGGLTLVERAPIDRLRHIVAGLELRLLGVLGQLPHLSACSQCGRSLADEPEPALDPRGGVFCAAHRPERAVRVPRAALGRLAELAAMPGRRWPSASPSALDRVNLGVLARWLAQALEALPRSRSTALRALDAVGRRAPVTPAARSPQMGS
jgi:recombinational DNA repair protein (RecF pathway)